MVKLRSKWGPHVLRLKPSSSYPSKGQIEVRVHFHFILHCVSHETSVAERMVTWGLQLCSFLSSSRARPRKLPCRVVFHRARFDPVYGHYYFEAIAIPNHANIRLRETWKSQTECFRTRLYASFGGTIKSEFYHSVSNNSARLGENTIVFREYFFGGRGILLMLVSLFCHKYDKPLERVHTRWGTRLTVKVIQ